MFGHSAAYNNSVFTSSPAHVQESRLLGMGPGLGSWLDSWAWVLARFKARVMGSRPVGAEAASQLATGKPSSDVWRFDGCAGGWLIWMGWLWRLTHDKLGEALFLVHVLV